MHHALLPPHISIRATTSSLLSESLPLPLQPFLSLSLSLSPSIPLPTSPPLPSPSLPSSCYLIRISQKCGHTRPFIPFPPPSLPSPAPCQHDNVADTSTTNNAPLRCAARKCLKGGNTLTSVIWRPPARDSSSEGPCGEKFPSRHCEAGSDAAQQIRPRLCNDSASIEHAEKGC
jgi:hypothetical protein